MQAHFALILPLNGEGQRFREAGYAEPKAFVKVLGKELLFWVLDTQALDLPVRVIVPYHAALRRWRLESRLRARYPRARFLFLPLPFDTTGALETLLLAALALKRDCPGECLPILSIDCDTRYARDMLAPFQQLLRLDYGPTNFVGCMRQELGGPPIYSYAALDPEDPEHILDLVEKSAVSQWACTGAYAFSSTDVFLRAAEQVLSDPSQRQKGEYYTSCVVRHMIHRLGKFFRVWEMAGQDVVCLGTPTQIGAAVAAGALRSVTTTQDPGSPDPEDPNPIIKDADTTSVSAPRHFHALTYDKGSVTKWVTSADCCEDVSTSFAHQISYMIGQHAALPINVLHRFFPRVLDYDSSSRRWYRMERVNGMTLSQLFVHEELEPNVLTRFLEQLHALHQSSHHVSLMNEDDEEKLLYANYVPKLHTRLSTLLAQCSSFSWLSAYMREILDLAKRCVKGLHKYREERLAKRRVIHGDPVLTNVLLLTDASHIVFIDPRGHVDGIATPFGDVMYDYAKVLQSLTGYDETLHATQVPASYRAALLRVFWKHVLEHHGERRADMLTTLVVSLLLSLLPMHVSSSAKQEEIIRGFVMQAQHLSFMTRST